MIYIYIYILSIGLLIYSLVYLLTFLCSLIYYLLTYLMCSAFPIVSRTWEPATSRLFFRCGWWAIRRCVTLDLEEMNQNGVKKTTQHMFFSRFLMLINISSYPQIRTTTWGPLALSTDPWSTGGSVEISSGANAGCAGGDLEKRAGRTEGIEAFWWSMVIQWWFHGVLMGFIRIRWGLWLHNGVLWGFEILLRISGVDVENHHFGKASYGPWLPYSYVFHYRRVMI